MKCIYCSSDTKYKVRAANGGRCGACRHEFAFEPNSDPLRVTDGLFQRIAKDVSGDGSLFFTERQLWYEFNRRLWRKSVSVSGGAVLGGVSGLGGAILAVVVHSVIPFGLGLCGVAAGIVMHRKNKRSGPPPRAPKVSLAAFGKTYLGRWVSVHGPVAKLLPPYAPPATRTLPDNAPDLTAYSFDRALVTESTEVAAMLVANNFHFENNCAVLSARGYPEGVAETVMTMLRRNPRLVVFVLHDASANGLQLPGQMRQAQWFPDSAIRIVDLGLRPRHAQQMHLLVLQAPPTALPDVVRGTLTPDELQWLGAGHIAELSAMRPAKLMRAVYQGFARAKQGDALAGNVDGGGGVWIYDGGVDVYAADSFG